MIFYIMMLGDLVLLNVCFQAQGQMNSRQTEKAYSSALSTLNF